MVVISQSAHMLYRDCRRLCSVRAAQLHGLQFEPSFLLRGIGVGHRGCNDGGCLHATLFHTLL